ncbi:response regulator [Flavobacterium sp. '19STA2R22 D10 B1']|uniref:response regulator n=1 Tax=Flavobacterium aerium TaxID=3037261 RepID=UPI00278BBD6D|nr:response regulator [Flavobacterium sp. '19STA2R22 D10 B1']
MTFFSFGQSKSPNRNDVYKLILHSDSLLINLNFKESLELSNVALKNAIKLKDNDLIALAYNNIASSHGELSDVNQSINYYNKALHYANKTNNDTIKDILYNNIGHAYSFGKKDYLNGIKYFKKSLTFAEKIADTTQILFTKLNLTEAYFNKKDFESGLPFLLDSDLYIKRYGDVESKIIINKLYGLYYANKKLYAQAKERFLKSINTAISTNNKTELAGSYQSYYQYLASIGNFKEAFQNLELFQKIKQEINNKEQIKSGQIAGVKIEVDEFKREVEKVEVEKEAQLQNLKMSKLIVILFLVVFIILLLFLLTLYRNNNLKRKLNEFLLAKNEELIRSKEHAEESSKLKSQFISTISHELRTPLYGVVGITDMLIDKHKELDNSEDMKSLKFSAQYLLTLVNDILQINKIEDKNVVLEILPFIIAEEFNKIKEGLHFIAMKNNNNLVLEIDPNIPKHLKGDKIRLSQILLNLTNNALKFTNNGQIILKAEFLNQKENTCFIKFQVIDNGCGIASENQSMIFEKFVQIDRKNDDYQGTGLGLSIVKGLITFFDSEIIVNSEKNIGTTFSFTIGFDLDTVEEKETAVHSKLTEANNPSFKVLVVEDNKINQMVTRKILEKNNYTCLIVDDGYLALELLEKEDFDVVLMDINMPLINGFETTKLIRQKGMMLPVIALTAFDKDEIQKEAVDSGIDDIIIKPFISAKLFEIITKQIYIKRNAG